MCVFKSFSIQSFDIVYFTKACLRADVTVFTRLEVKQDGVLSLGRRATVFNAQLLQGQGSVRLLMPSHHHAQL